MGTINHMKLPILLRKKKFLDTPLKINIILYIMKAPSIVTIKAINFNGVLKIGSTIGDKNIQFIKQPPIIPPILRITADIIIFILLSLIYCIL